MRTSAFVLALLGFVALGAPAAGQNIFMVTSFELPFNAPPGTQFASQVLFDTTDVGQGWSFGVCTDDLLVNVVDAVEGATTATVNQGGPPDFIVIETDPVVLGAPGYTMGVVISFTGMDTLPPGTGYEILDTTIEWLGNPGDTTDACFCDTLGDPPVATVFVVSGQSNIPEQMCGTFNQGEPPVSPVFQNVTCTSSPTSVLVEWEVVPSDFEYVSLHRNGELLEIYVPGTSGSYLDEPLDPGTYLYTLIGVSFPDPMGDRVIEVATCSADVIPVTIENIDPNLDAFCGGADVTITGTGFTAAMDTTVLFGMVTADNIVIVDDNTITCNAPAADFIGLVDVSVSNSLGGDTVVEGFTYGFIRSDSNADCVVDLADVVYSLEYLFTQGPIPICLASADVDGNTILDIADPVTLANYLFIGGPPPAAPFPDPGTDAAPLGCAL